MSDASTALPRRLHENVLLGVLGLVIVVWSLLPIYHMVVLSLTPPREGFAGHLWPVNPTLANYVTVLTQADYYLAQFWQQLGNSALIAVAATAIVLACSLMASFAISRLRPRFGSLVSYLALVAYFVPATFLAIPFYQVMGTYGLLGNQLALVLCVVAFATPYAIWVLQQNAHTLPDELDDAARIDGAGPLQMFTLIYVPLMLPTIVAVGAFALMLSWNEYLYAFLLLSDESRFTIPVMLGQFMADDAAPWPLLMTSGVIYMLPPTALYYVARQFQSSGMMSGSVKG
ncbi:MAG: carbohydrate ABC transporter permease [Devosia sp.]|uniref:carbohydrate ABC transporter permease n=1 Tax=Devosia sp. 66-22 TaxID=1895753 RepID=UPI00092CE000|nr:carbohydrate ABC transporter permease [Devosia sp. 66-22]MBN9348505.1 carbohydrate ABC transporter permease [Devosia sp.]OJX55396.1 MAG: ABC transporter permease [Devosia sp. 66-22]